MIVDMTDDFPEVEDGFDEDIEENGFYDEAVEMAAETLQTEILSDQEASTALMGLALPLSIRHDRDQQSVADDISAAFLYSHGMSPEDYADSVRSEP